MSKEVKCDYCGIDAKELYDDLYNDELGVDISFIANFEWFCSESCNIKHRQENDLQD